MRDSDSPSGGKTPLLQVRKSRGPGRSANSRLDRTGVRTTQVMYCFIVSLLAAGTLLTAGCAKKQVGVPDLTRQDLDQAQKALAALQLKAGPVANTGPGAYVVQQIPAAGTMVDANSTVNLVVELPVSVPSLVGGTITDAVSTLQGLGLRVAFLSKHTMNPFAKSKVDGQDPTPGTLVHRDTMVRLTVISPGGNAEALLNAVTNEPAYKNLDPKYKSFLNLFLADPNTSRDMEPQDAQGSAPAPIAPSAPPK
jgi:beta-lactam-binding protein with PASTA domain